MLTWPDGLAHLSEAMRRYNGMQALDALPADAQWRFAHGMSLAASALHIREEDAHVDVIILHHHSGERILLRARHVISALPLNIAARIVAHPDRYGLNAPLPASAPWLIGNFLLDRYPQERDHAELAWDSVIHTSPALGYIHANHQHIRTAKAPYALFTTYSALNHAPPVAIRAWLQYASDDELLAHAAQDLIHAYGKNIFRHTRQVDITLRGHGMAIPAPGYLDLLPVLRAHHSRLNFAHSDLSGYSVVEEAIYWGAEAARKRLSA